MSLATSSIPQRARALAVFDVRAGEARSIVLGPAALLLLIITAHTVLETARDALLITGPGPRALGVAYMLIAACTLPASAIAARASQRFGPRRALAVTVAIGVALPPVMFAVLPATAAAAVAVYVLSGVLGSVVVPQFWTFLGSRVTVAQGRRLFGVISTGGTIGGVLGPALASGALVFVPLRDLLLVSAFVFVLAGGTLALLPRSERRRPGSRRVPSAVSLGVFRGRPFVTRLAFIVCLSTATFLCLDYLFKSSIAHALPRAEIGPFVARYYLALNLVSLAIQFFASGPLVRALGIATALLVTPLLLAFGAVGVLIAGGALAAILVAKGIDGGLRYSVHRVTEELAYLPIPSAVRLRAKPFVDGALVRTTQTLVGAGLWWGKSLSPSQLAAVVAALAMAWAITALAARRPYLALLRLAVTNGPLNTHDAPEPLDLASAEILVQRLASGDPLEVIGALDALARRKRIGLVSALVLLHRHADVLLHALEIFGGSKRSDWFPLAKRLLEDEREVVRVAAARALARHDQLAPESLARRGGDQARGYTAVCFALRDRTDDATTHPRVAELLSVPGEEGRSCRLGMLAAIADAPHTGSLSPLLLELSRNPPFSTTTPELLARAAAQQRELRMIPCLIGLLSIRDGREAVRDALVGFGEPALGEVSRALYDAARPRGLRLHVPKTLARFGSKRAAECLLQNIETERDGGIRYRSIRALALLASARGAVVDRSRVERICRTDLHRHFRLLGRRADLLRLEAPRVGTSVAVRLLSGLLEDKIRQSLDRACLLLQIAHPDENLHGVYLACLSEERERRGTAAEFLDTLLRRSDEAQVRAMLRLVADDLPPEDRLEQARARGWSDRVASLEDTLAALIDDPDVTVASLAAVLAQEKAASTSRPLPSPPAKGLVTHA